MPGISIRGRGLGCVGKACGLGAALPVCMRRGGPVGAGVTKHRPPARSVESRLAPQPWDPHRSTPTPNCQTFDVRSRISSIQSSKRMLKAWVLGPHHGPVTPQASSWCFISCRCLSLLQPQGRQSPARRPCPLLRPGWFLHKWPLSLASLRTGGFLPCATTRAYFTWENVASKVWKDSNLEYNNVMVETHLSTFRTGPWGCQGALSLEAACLYSRAAQVAQQWGPGLRCRRPRFDPWVRKTQWRKEQQPTPVFLPGESLGQRSLAGCSPRGCGELDTTEWLSTHASAFPPDTVILTQG